MKRLISSVIILALLMNFVACASPQETVYDKLNKFSKQSYSEIKLDVTTVTDGAELTAHYTLTADKVEYSVEQFSLLPTDGQIGDASESYKFVTEGTATVEGNKIVSDNGEDVDIPAYNELKGGFDFKASYFTNIKNYTGKFSADVLSVSLFFGVSKDISNVKLVVEYSETALESIVISYETANSTVTSVYSFTE